MKTIPAIENTCQTLREHTTLVLPMCCQRYIKNKRAGSCHRYSGGALKRSEVRGLVKISSHLDRVLAQICGVSLVCGLGLYAGPRLPETCALKTDQYNYPATSGPISPGVSSKVCTFK